MNSYYIRKIKRIASLAWWILAIPIWLSAQGDILETIDMQLNSDFLVTGENLFFKLFCHDKPYKPSTLSRIAYVEIISPDLKPIFQTKISLERGEGYGYFFIPSNIPSGNYSLLAYTQWMRNFEAISKKEITIVNPFDKGYIKTESNLKLEPPKPLDENALSLKLSVKNKFHTRDSVVIKLENNDPRKQFHLSVNVVRHPKRLMSTFIGGTFPIQNQLKAIKFLPDMRGEIITGRVLRSSNHMPLANVNISLSSVGANYTFNVAKTDSDGYFQFNLSDSNGMHAELIVEVLDDGSDSFIIESTNQFLEDYRPYAPSMCFLDSSLISEIKNRSISNQIENIYFSVKRDSLHPTKCCTRFYGTADKVYNLDNYTRLPTLEDILREFVPEVVVSKREEALEMKVRDSQNKNSIFSNKPLVLLDGIPVTSYGKLFNYDVSKLKRIEIVTKRFFYSSFQADGIVSFETYQGRAEGFSVKATTRLSYIPLQIIKSTYNPMYLDAKLERIPDYRIQLYWNPKVEVKSLTNLRFFTSDIESSFLIEVSGYSSDGEDIIHLTRSFIVTK